MGNHLPETKRRLQAEYRSRNVEKLRCASRHRRAAIKDEALTQYGRCCARCGFDNPLALVVDHVDDNGAEERKALGGQHFAGWNFYSHLRRQGWPDGYQTLCANCNMIKQQTLLQNAGVAQR